MTTTLNLKKLIVGTRVEDKAKLCFADRLKRADSNGKEWVLTPQEREAIYEDARKNHQMPQLNTLINQYNVVIFMWSGIGRDFQSFGVFKGVTDYIYYLIDFLPQETYDAMKKDLFRFDLDSLSMPATSGVSPMELYAMMIGKALLIKKTIYQIEYVEKLANMSFLSESMRKELDGYSEQVKEVDEHLEKLKLQEKHKEEAEAEANWMIERFSKINFNTNM